MNISALVGASKCISLCFIVLLQGCSTLSYYHQAVTGQSELLSKSRPIAEVLADRQLDPAVRSKLLVVQKARAFAISELGLPDNDSYRDYADLQRRYVMWSVFATPRFSLTPLQWCYPFVGCISYRNYFFRADAQAYALKLESEGYDVHLTGVPAYSTIGWFDDPVINTMMHWQDYDLVGTLFHEMAHQKSYIKNDTVFNESLAKAIEQIGLQRWMKNTSQQHRYVQYLIDEQREKAFVGIVQDARKKLQGLYAQNTKPESGQFRAKLDIFRELRRNYIKLRKQWNGYDAYDHWILSGVNNAKVQSVATYYDYVPAFKYLLALQGDDLSLFYKQIEKLMVMDRLERDEYLRKLGGQ